MNVDSNTLTTFFLGAISAIVIGVIANLLTPDRQSLINLIKNWYGRLSKERASARIQSLKEELDGISDGITFPNKVTILFQEVMALTVKDFGLVGVALILSFSDQTPPVKYLLMLLVGLMFTKIYQRATKLANVYSKIINFDKYKKETETLIQKFEKIVQEDNGNDKTKTG